MQKWRKIKKNGDEKRIGAVKQRKRGNRQQIGKIEINRQKMDDVAKATKTKLGENRQNRENGEKGHRQNGETIAKQGNRERKQRNSGKP